jgi:hypothetical protein
MYFLCLQDCYKEPIELHLAGFLLYSEDGSGIFFINIDGLLADYTVLE